MLHPDDHLFGSLLCGEDPAGCVHCREGAKMVLLVTGLCTRGCYYCPLSRKKMGKDVVYANELLVWNDKKRDAETDHSETERELTAVNRDNAIIEEARSISATGTGITGGDPLVMFDRTLHFIRLLKDRFGPDHHIHLYTASIPDRDHLTALKEAGLDEIRYHPMDVLDFYSEGDPLGNGCDLEDFLEPHLDAIRSSLEIALITGVEIPAIPGQRELLSWMIPRLEAAGCQFLNLNELEFSPTNAENLLHHGFAVRDELSSAVLGSREMVSGLFELIRDTGNNCENSPSDTPRQMSIHFCSSQYKDAGQLRRRLHRRAKNTALPYELITGDETLFLGVIEPSWDLEEFAGELKEAFDIPDELVHVNLRLHRIEIAPWVLQEISDDIPAPCFLIEEYPTADRLEVEREQLKKPDAGDM